MSERLQRLRENDGSGFTLIELLVAMLITSMVLAMAGTFFVNVTKLTVAARASREGLAQAELAVGAVRTVVTMASDNTTADSGTTTPAVASGSATSLSVISYANSTAAAVVPSMYTYTVDASGYLTESRQAGVLASTGYWTFTGTTTSRKIAGPFVTSSGTPFFSYIDSTGAVLTPTSTGLAATDLTKVAFVRVTAKVAAKTSAGVADPIVITSSIGLTNVYRDVGAAVSLPSLSGGQ